MIKKLFIFLVLFFSGLFAQNCFSQNPAWPKTLLWRITGKDLKKPSYLFGTIHLQDKRIFNLGDSLYHYFEKAEGFAVEIDFNEYLDSVIGRIFQQEELKQQQGETNVSDKKRKGVKIDVKDSLDLVIPNNQPSYVEMGGGSKKELRKLRSQRIKQLLKYGEMPTILDAYLYSMAMKQRKWLGAVEDVKDQLSIVKDELGGDIDENEINLPMDELILYYEQLIKIYLEQDLDGIENFIETRGKTNSIYLNLNSRNVKMVRSIDSLSNLRSMFYAVGAAHLPGDSGLIRLLREKGYIVSPVFSTNKLAAEKYAERLPSLSWFEINDTTNYYSIEMPGIPKDYNIFGELVKMKVFVDITTMSFYMTGSTISESGEDKLDVVLNDMAKEMAKNGKIESAKKIVRNGIKVMEGIVDGGNVYFRIQLAQKNGMLYMIMLGAEKRANILTPSADRYFASFKFLANPDEGKVVTWKELHLPDKGIKVWLPSQPKLNKSLAKMAEGTGWQFTVYDCTDILTSMYYAVRIQDIAPGLYLDGDSSYFSLFKEQMVNNVKKVEKEEIGLFGGFPYCRYDATGVTDIFYKTKNVIRGNRIYTLIVIGSLSRKDDPSPDRFFNSIELLDYKKSEWKTHSSPDKSFSSWAAAPFVLDKEGGIDALFGDSEKEEQSYVSYNSNEVISYQVLKSPVSPYYWAESDSAFYESNLQWDDSLTFKVLSAAATKNGNLSGREKIVQISNNNNLMKTRVFLNGDTIYTLLSFIPTQYIKNENHKKFFDEFRVKNDHIPSTILVNKAEKLLSALQSADSATQVEAVSAIYDINFTKKELPFLHKALLQAYPDDSLIYGSARQEIVEALNDISDSSTVDFIKRNYHQLAGEKEVYKVSLLNVLAGQHTAYSYAELKNLLLNHLPKETGKYFGISYQLNDSLLLTKQLFPELLTLLRNKFLKQDVLRSTAQLLDSNMISIDIIKPYEKELLYHVDTLLNSSVITDEDFDGWGYVDIIHLVGKLNTAATHTALQKLAVLNDLKIKLEAVLRLYENNQPVPASETEKLAASNECRILLYKGLKEIGKLSFFPAKYLTQRYFAEAELYNCDDSPDSMEMVAEKEVLFNGKKQRFFLFKIDYEGEEDEFESYLGIAGPYSMDLKNIESSGEITFVDFDKEYDEKKINQQFEIFLKGVK